MTNSRLGMIALLALSAAACAAQTYQPLIDRGVPPPIGRNEYQDTSECRQLEIGRAHV